MSGFVTFYNTKMHIMIRSSIILKLNKVVQWVVFSYSQPAHEEEEEMSMSPGVSEFVSDAFDSTGIDQEDLRKEMEQLVLDKKDSPQSLDG